MPRSYWRSCLDASTWGFALAVAALGCDETAADRDVPPTGSARSAADAPDVSDAAPRPPQRPLAAMRLPPRPAPAQRLAFARHRLGRLLKEAVEILDTKKFEVEAEIPLVAPRAIASAPDGSLFAVGAREVVRIPRKGAPERRQRVNWMAHSRLFVDPRLASSLWLHHAHDPTLYRYEYGRDAGPGIAQFLELKGFEGGALGQLPDGAFAAAKKDGLVRFFPDGKSESYPLPDIDSGVWRLSRARRIDRVWVAENDGDMHLHELVGRGRTVRSVELGSVGYELVSSDRAFAVLGVAGDVAQPTRWHLAVFDHRGTRRFETELGEDSGAPAIGDTWAAFWVRNRSVAVTERFVAVGGPTRVVVWDVAKKKQRYEAP